MSGESDYLFSSADSLIFQDIGHGVDLLSSLEKGLFEHDSSFDTVAGSDISLPPMVHDDDVFGTTLGSTDIADDIGFSVIEDRKSLGETCATSSGGVLSSFGGGVFGSTGSSMDGNYAEEQKKSSLQSSQQLLHYTGGSSFQDVYTSMQHHTHPMMILASNTAVPSVDCSELEAQFQMHMQQMQMANVAATTSERLNNLSLDQIAEHSGVFGQNLVQQQGLGQLPGQGLAQQGHLMSVSVRPAGCQQNASQGLGTSGLAAQGFSQAASAISQMRVGRSLPPMQPVQGQLQRQGSLSGSTGGTSPVARRHPPAISSPRSQQHQYVPNSGCSPELPTLSMPAASIAMAPLPSPKDLDSNRDHTGSLLGNSSDGGEHVSEQPCQQQQQQLLLSSNQPKTIFMPSAGLVHRATVAAEAAGLLDAGGDGLRPLPTMPHIPRPTMHRSHSSHALGQLRTPVPTAPIPDARLQQGFPGLASLGEGTSPVNRQLPELQGMTIRPMIPGMAGMRRVHSTGDIQALNAMATVFHGHGGLEGRVGFDDGVFKIGRYTMEERKNRIHRYREKRNERNFNKKIKYACRKTLADSRPRVRGRFARNDEVEETMVKRELEEEESEAAFEDEMEGENDLDATRDVMDMVKGLNSYIKLEPTAST